MNLGNNQNIRLNLEFCSWIIHKANLVSKYQPLLCNYNLFDLAIKDLKLLFGTWTQPGSGRVARCRTKQKTSFQEVF